jgi:glycosyltransferase involved in cell wall biosynthesis
VSVRARGGIVLIVSGFPRLSETFALNELLALDRKGALAAIFATKPGDGAPPHPGAAALLDRVEVLPPGDPEAQAAHVVRSLDPAGVAGVHGYFAHDPAAVAEHAARTLGVPFSFSAHAKDVRKVERGELTRRARVAACVVACNGAVARELRGQGARVDLLPHGVDLARFRATAPVPGDSLRLLAVGRLVEKKGFAVLIAALRDMPGPVTARIVGGGPLLGALGRAASEADLDDRVRLTGALTHDELPAAYAAADVVVVPSVRDAHGDCDGLPNVVLEAMACGRPVVASDIAAIPTAVRDGETGLLVPPGDALALRAALERLRRDPVERARLGAAARVHAEDEFELGRCTERWRARLEAAYGLQRAHA